MIKSSVTTFPCPNCHEFINTGLDKCRHCSSLIDPRLADAALQLQEKVNTACNSASLIRNMAGVMWVFFFIGFIPFIKVVGAIGILVLFILVRRRGRGQRHLLAPQRELAWEGAKAGAVGRREYVARLWPFGVSAAAAVG